MAAAAAPAAVVKGVVLDSLTGRALSRTKVTLLQLASTQTGSPSLEAVTDSYGRFDFKVAPGTYVLEASRLSYAKARFGQQAWNLPGAPFHIDADGLIVAELRMRRLGAITGEVWDENHLGIPKTRVLAYRPGKNLKLAAASTADDRGIYRLFGLEPGRYLVRTAPVDFGEGNGLLPTFYGQSTRHEEGAVPVEVRLDQETPGVNIEPVHGTMFPVRIATAADSSRGTAAVRVNVTLHTDTGTQTLSVPLGEIAEFPAMPPGTYEATAEATLPQDGSASAYLKFVVDKPDFTPLLQLSRAPTVFISCSSRQGTAVLSDSVRITAERVLPPDGATLRAPCSRRVSFPAGVWKFRAGTLPGTFLDEVQGPFYGKPYDFTVDFTRVRNYSDLVFLFSSAAGIVRGVVKGYDGAPAIGAPVFLKALDESVRVKLGKMPFTLSGEDGGFQFLTLPPGQYEVLSTLQLGEPDEGWWDLPAGKPVLLEAGKTENVTISLTELPVAP